MPSQKAPLVEGCCRRKLTCNDLTTILTYPHTHIFCHLMTDGWAGLGFIFNPAKVFLFISFFSPLPIYFSFNHPQNAFPQASIVKYDKCSNRDYVRINCYILPLLRIVLYTITQQFWRSICIWNLLDSDTLSDLHKQIPVNINHYCSMFPGKILL